MVEEQVISVNRKAWHDYQIDETYEVGMALRGTEVKSLRARKVSLKESYAEIRNGEIFIVGLHISPYEAGNQFNHDPKRTRKLLMHKAEIRKLIGKTREKGYTLIPLKLYFNNKGRAKLEIGLARGKKMYDKRQDIAKKEADRDLKRAMVSQAKGKVD